MLVALQITLGGLKNVIRLEVREALDSVTPEVTRERRLPPHLPRWIGIALVVLAGVGYLIYSATGSSAEYYETIGEMRAHPSGQDVRVLGTVVPLLSWARAPEVAWQEDGRWRLIGDQQP